MTDYCVGFDGGGTRFRAAVAGLDGRVPDRGIRGEGWSRALPILAGALS
jgi:N-acetylglucosamine kinase-like BadF-type ATPase